MGQRAEALFGTLRTWEALATITGQSENSDFDCKQWGSPSQSRGSIAKAACGFANATGGIIIIGMDARSPRSGEPDVVQGFAPVTDTSAVGAQVQEIILNGIEPGIQDVQVREVRQDDQGSISGCVVVYIPEQEGPPQRTRTDGKFYVRIASGTVPMEYFQLEDRFGRRPHAHLVVEPSEIRFRTGTVYVAREVTLFVRNNGRGIARFPALHCYRDTQFTQFTGPYGTNVPTWPHLDKDEARYSFRGRADDVLYPGEALNIAVLEQRGRPNGPPVIDGWGHQVPNPSLLFEPVRLHTQVVCEGMAANDQQFEWNGDSFTPN